MMVTPERRAIWPSLLVLPDDENVQAQLSRLSGDDWTWLVRQAEAHQLTAMLYWRVQQNSLATAVPGAVYEYLRRYYRAAAKTSLHRQAELFRVLRALTAVGLRPILFKGAALAHAVYPTPVCRPMNDVDIWLQPDEMAQAWRIFEELGYEQKSKQERPLSLQRLHDGEIQFFGAQPGQGLIELHWGVFPGAWLKQASRVEGTAVYQRILPLPFMELPIYTLAPEDDIIQIASHIAINHQLSINALRSLLDFALLAARPALDWNLVLQRVTAWQLTTAFGLVSQLVADLFSPELVRPATDALPLSPLRRRALFHFVNDNHILQGRLLALSPRRLFYLLALVDQPASGLKLFTHSLWPDAVWLSARYGDGRAATRLGHVRAFLRGEV